MTASRNSVSNDAPTHRSSVRGHVSRTGRLSLPAELRRAVGLERGGPVRIEIVDGAIRIRTMQEVKDHIRALARESGLAGKASVDDFLKQRAADRADEAKKASKR